MRDPKTAGQAARESELNPVALAVVKTQGGDSVIGGAGPKESGGRVNTAGKKDEAFFHRERSRFDIKEETCFFQGRRFTWPALFAIL
jgi:hypothetical protein